jgi:hypothetical protein
VRLRQRSSRAAARLRAVAEWHAYPLY